MPSEQAICRAKAVASILVIFREFIKIPSEFTICQSELSSVGDILLRSAYKKGRCFLPSSKIVKIEKFMSRLYRDVREMYKTCAARAELFRELNLLLLIFWTLSLPSSLS